MQEYIIILKGTNKLQASFEFENLWKLYLKENIKLEQLNNTFYSFKSNLSFNNNINNFNFFERLTFTNQIYRILLSSNDLSNFNLDMKTLNMNEINFDNKLFSANIKKINFYDNSFNYDDYLKPVFNRILNPKVDLKNSDIELFFFENNFDNEFKLRFGYKIFENKKSYLKRMPKLRPIKKPYTLKSDMARAAINYLNIKAKNSIILDPFAGIGGILLEAYDMDFEVVGNDINWNDLNHIKTNFNYFFKENNILNDNNKNKITLSCADSRKQFLKENSIDGIVTDIPYGKSSRLLGEELYEDFLKSARIYLKSKKRLVIIYANFTPFKNLALKYFDEVVEIEEYINKSMTRYILVLENNK